MERTINANLESLAGGAKHTRPSMQAKKCKILTDSQPALQALNNINFKLTIALKTAEAVENISWRTQKCTIAWVKSDIGTEGNEAADEVARKGEENKTNTISIIIKTPPSVGTSKEILDYAIRTEWKKMENCPSLQTNIS